MEINQKKFDSFVSTIMMNEENEKAAREVYRQAKKAYGVFFMNDALNGVLFENHRPRAQRAAELRACERESLKERNILADSLCGTIGWLATQSRENFGESFLSRFYDCRKMMIHQKDISEAIAEIEEFCELYEAAGEPALGGNWKDVFAYIN